MNAIVLRVAVEKHVAVAVVGMEVVEKEVEQSCVEVNVEIEVVSLPPVVRDLDGGGSAWSAMEFGFPPRTRTTKF